MTLAFTTLKTTRVANLTRNLEKALKFFQDPLYYNELQQEKLVLLRAQKSPEGGMSGGALAAFVLRCGSTGPPLCQAATAPSR